MMFAQLTTPAPDANSFLQFWIIVGFIAAIALTFVSIWAMTRKKSRTEISPNPLSVNKQPKHYNHDLSENRHNEVWRRLGAHDAEIEQIWTTFRAEDASIRKENTETMKTILLALGRIQGRLGIEPKDQI